MVSHCGISILLCFRAKTLNTADSMASIFPWSARETFIALFYLSKLFLAIGCTANEEHNRSYMLQDLFKGYDSDAHPRSEGSGPVIVTFGAKLVRLIELRERANTIQSQWWIQQSWQNSRLCWNESKYVETIINVAPTRVWTPDILLYNSGETNDRLAGGVEKYKTKVIIESSGYNKWYAPAMFKSTCDINPQYFPFDDQHCKLQFGSWSFDQSKLDINVDLNETGVKKDIYQENSEWELVELEAKKFVKIYPCCPNAFPSIILHLHLRRRSKYYLVNLVIPCSLIAAMILLSFILPPESGERIGLGITVLMAMAIFQELTSEKLPVDSKNVPLLANYYATGITEIGLALVSTAIIINFHHRKTKMPAWFRKITFGCLGKLVRIKWTPSAMYKPVPLEMKELPKRKVFYDDCACGKFSRSDSFNVMDNVDVTGVEDKNVAAGVMCENGGKEAPIMNTLEKETPAVDCTVTESTTQNIREWQTAAQIFDRLLLIVGIFVSLISVVAIFLQAPRVYEMFLFK